jgi:hypothetical protein
MVKLFKAYTKGATVDGKSLIGQQLWPKRTPALVRESVLMNVAAAVWLTVSSIQVAIWVLICLIGWRLAFPFWIWFTAGGAVVLAIMGAIVANRR